MGSKIPILPKLEFIASKLRVPKRTHTVSEALVIKNGSSLVLQGWLDRRAKQLNKGLTFANMRDTEGNITQLVDTQNPSRFKSLKPDSAITVECLKDGADLQVQHVHVLNEANLVPGELQAEETKEWPAKYRYIQLRQPRFQQILRTRAAIVRTCRAVLDNLGFTEVETPILFKSTPEGAREFLVPTRRKGYMYALPQSPQQYKQLLIASGIDKYYQVAKCFRDEDLRADRQPEFTQLDLEMGFAAPEDVQHAVEQVVKAVWDLVGREIVSPGHQDGTNGFAKLTYDECIAKYGIDKPDLRSQARIWQIPEVTARANQNFPVLEVLKLSEDLPSELIKDSPRVKFVTFESEAQLRDVVDELAVYSESADSAWGNIFKVLSEDLGAKPGDLLAFSDRQRVSYENPTPLGRLRQHLTSVELEKHGSPSKSIAAWVHKFPSFEPLELRISEQGYPEYDLSQLKATHHPFTMVDLEDYEILEKGEPLNCHGMHFDLVIDGVEVGGGSQRIHDSELQRYILKNVVGVEDPDYLFGHLLEALATGCPPHAGLAIGFDRMVAMLVGTKSIRDVIAFPKTMRGTDPVVNSPSKPNPKQLEPYRIQVT